MSRMAGMRIGELASAARVSTRTVRYYEERELLRPASHSPGGERRYDEHSLERLQRIRELADILGSDLDEIGSVLEAEDRLAAMRGRSRPDDPPTTRLARVAQAEAINVDLRARISDRIEALVVMRDNLYARYEYYQELRADLEPQIEAEKSAQTPG